MSEGLPHCTSSACSLQGVITSRGAELLNIARALPARRGAGPFQGQGLCSLLQLPLLLLELEHLRGENCDQAVPVHIPAPYHTKFHQAVYSSSLLSAACTSSACIFCFNKSKQIGVQIMTDPVRCCCLTLEGQLWSSTVQPLPSWQRARSLQAAADDE